MAEAFAGQTGSGSVVVYSVPSGFTLALEMLHFIATTDGTAGIHKARVSFYDNRLNRWTATLRDLNEGGPNEQLTYTYGMGLSASACVTIDGWEMTDALPYTILAPDTDIVVSMVYDNGASQSGDTIDVVTLYGELTSVVPADTVTLIPGLLPA